MEEHTGPLAGDVAVGDVLCLVDSEDSAHSKAAWTHLQNAAQHVVQSKRVDAAYVSKLLIVAASENWTALRRAPPETPLRGWLHGALKNQQRQESRTQLRQAPEHFEDLDAQEVTASTAEQGWSELDLEKLTPAQRVVVKFRLEGKTIADVGRATGRSPTTVRELLERAARRLRGDSAPPNDDREWAAEMLRTQRFPPSHLDLATTRLVLAMHIVGATRHQIANVRGVSADAIRQRLRRWKSWAGRRQGGHI